MFDALANSRKTPFVAIPADSAYGGTESRNFNQAKFLETATFARVATFCETVIFV
jgi:hypothetical protein